MAVGTLYSLQNITGLITPYLMFFIKKITNSVEGVILLNCLKKKLEFEILGDLFHDDYEFFGIDFRNEISFFKGKTKFK